jgi:hypothetical protein
VVEGGAVAREAEGVAVVRVVEGGEVAEAA